MIGIEERIEAFTKQSEEVKESIIRGSDEHLDVISSLKASFDRLTKLLSDFSEDLIISSTKGDYIELDPINKLKSILGENIRLIALTKSKGLNNDLPVAFSHFLASNEQFREILFDLQNFRLNKINTLDTYLEELNNL